MEKRKKRFWSLMLSILMVVGLLWAVPGDSKAVAEDKQPTYVSFSGDISGQLTTEGQIKDSNDCLIDLTAIKLIADKGEMKLNVNKIIGNSTMVVTTATDSSVIVNDGCTFECGSFSGNIENNGTFVTSQFDATSLTGTFKNNGTFVTSQFDTTSLTGTFKNNGVVKADKVIQ